MRKLLIRVICAIVLIPVLGIAVPFGGGYVYGTVRHAEKKAKAIEILNAHEDELIEAANARKDPQGIGIEETEYGKGCAMFQLPHEGKIGSWVPCGLMYMENGEEADDWIKREQIRDEWYFYWIP